MAGRASCVIWRRGFAGGGTVGFGWSGAHGTVGASASIIFPRRVMGVEAPLVQMGWCPPDCRFLCLHYLSLFLENPEDFPDGVQ